MIITRFLLKAVNLTASGEQFNRRRGGGPRTAGSVVALLYGMLIVVMIPIDIVLTIVWVAFIRGRRRDRTAVG